MDENVFLLHSFLLGVGITFLYDILRILRRVFAHSTSMVSLEDLAFWIYCAGKVFLLMFHESNGNLRWFAVLGALAGMYLYHRTISPFFVKYVALGLNTLLHPIRKALRITGNWLKKQLTILRKMLKIFIKRRCAYGKKKSSLPQETPESVQYVPGDPGQEKRDSSLLAELLHIPGIFSGLRANAVIHMHYGNVCRYFLLPFQQQK
jgi:spore cortex biosynthesis protein YabQ